MHTQLEAIEAAEQFCALRKRSLTVFLSVQQSQALRVALEEEPQPHWLAVMGALVRLKRGNRELEQLQAKELFVKFIRSTLEVFTCTTTSLEVALRLVTFWKRAALATALLVMQVLTAGVRVQPQSPVDCWYSQAALA